ncbi:MAG: PEP-CTERM sorting domain-containing protein [Planctomycetota bacterium]
MTNDDRSISVNGSLTETGGGSGFSGSSSPPFDGADFNDALDQDVNATVGDGIVIGRATQNSTTLLEPNGFVINGFLRSEAVVNDPTLAESSFIRGDAGGQSVFDITLQLQETMEIAITGRWETDGLTATDNIVFGGFGLAVNPAVLTSGSQDTFVFDNVVGPGTFNILALTQNQADADADINIGELEFRIVGQVIPEPSSFLVIAAGSLIASINRRRRPMR